MQGNCQLNYCYYFHLHSRQSMLQVSLSYFCGQYDLEYRNCMYKSSLPFKSGSALVVSCVPVNLFAMCAFQAVIFPDLSHTTVKWRFPCMFSNVFGILGSELRGTESWESKALISWLRAFLQFIKLQGTLPCWKKYPVYMLWNIWW
jgi:hypothetical protein